MTSLLTANQLTVAGLITRLLDMPQDRPVFIHNRPARDVVETQSLHKGSDGVVKVEIR